MNITLQVQCTEHQVLKDYLQENASAILADKINHGVFIENDGKRVLNRKDFDTFMKYACDKAKELAAKGATFACHSSDVVFGWLIHYFEEDSIEGILYNEDGSKYEKPIPKPVAKPVQSVPTPTISTKPAPPKQQQFSLFDLINNQVDTPAVQESKQVIEEQPDEITTKNTPPQEPITSDNVTICGQYIVERETGEILGDAPTQAEDDEDDFGQEEMDILEQERELMKAFDKEALCILYDLFDGELDLQ